MITLDTGALIALQKRQQRIVKIVAVAREQRIPMFVPSVCVAEWWRRRTDLAEQIFDAMRIEHTDDTLVKVAGEAIGVVRGAGVADALVMATAARRGGVVYTSDIDDLTALTRVFPAVRVLHC